MSYRPGRGAAVNAGGHDDPEVSALLDEARSELDPDKRRAIYEDLNREFAEELYYAWLDIPVRGVARLPNVEGIHGLPNAEGSPAYATLNGAHSPAGVWLYG